MNLISRAFSGEEEEKLRKLTFIRLVAATVMVGAAIMVLQIEGSPTSMAALYSLLGVIYLSSGSAYVIFRSGVPFKPLVWILTLVDLAVLTLIVHYSGGSGSFFTILYLLPIVMAGVYFQLTGGVIAAALAASAYIIYAFLEYSGQLYPIGSTQWNSSYPGTFMPLLRGYLHIAVFIFTGLISGYVSRRIKRKREELEIRERELKSVRLNTDSIIRNISSGLVVIGLDGEILSLNPAAVEILGLDQRVMDYRGRLVSDILEHMPELLHEIEGALRDKKPRRRQEVEVEREDGKKLSLGISVSLLRREGNEISGAIALFQDLTEVIGMRKRIRQADRMAAIGELSASIAHEIRAPLASICGSIEMLQGEIETTGENRDLMNLIMEESDRLDALITDFLEFARMKKPSLSSVDITACIRDVLTLLSNSPEVGRGISFDLRNRGAVLNVRVDDEQIKQVLLNLGMNACEAMGECGKLDIAVDRERVALKEGEDPVDCVKIEFANDGPHIEEEDMPRIFEPFFTTRDEGTGLGLATAARIIENHGGIIKAENRDGKGTVFTVLIPEVEKAVEREISIHERVAVNQNI